MTAHIGIERLLQEPKIAAPLKEKRVALVGHPASVTRDLTHSIDALMDARLFKLTAAFGPQHGMKGDKQYNMIETDDEIDPTYKIPIFSLYGKVRRPTPAQLDTFDVAMIDLQDAGTRIYTYVTTMLYMMEACAKTGKSLWVLDRPNPAGRPIEGLKLRSGWESFVGAGPIPMRHGLTLGELARWFQSHFKLDLDLKIVEMKGYDPKRAPGYGWDSTRTWINPSPNLPNPWGCRVYPGSVMVEGTTLSEGRGTTRPLEIAGAPDIDFHRVLGRMVELAPEWMKGFKARVMYFEPTFYKHVGKLCNGLHFHVEDEFYYQHESFRPYRAFALLFKAIRTLYPDYPLWRDFDYEYEIGKRAIDVINGSPLLREWVDDPSAKVGDFESACARDELSWKQESAPFLIY